MARFVVKNWSEFQHYKDRSPTWIKLHKSLLDNFEYQRLPIASKALAPMLWLLASENVDGSFDGDIEHLLFRLRWPKEDLISGIKPLINNGFISSVDGLLADCYQDAIPETERETYKPETERETEGEGALSPSKDGSSNASPSAQPKKSNRGTRLPDDWKLPVEWGEWAMEEVPGLTRADVKKEAAKFRDHWHSKPGKDGVKLDWEATWRNWMRSDLIKPSGKAPAGQSGTWFLSATGITEKGAERGIVQGEGELFPDFKARVYAEFNITDEMVRNAKADQNG